MHLEPEIVMEVASRMFLNDKPPPASLATPARRFRRRLSRPREVSFGRVFFQRPDRAPRLCLLVGSKLGRQLLFQLEDRREKVPEFFEAL